MLFNIGGQLISKKYITYLDKEKEKRIIAKKVFMKYLDIFLNKFDSIEYVVFATRGPFYMEKNDFGMYEISLEKFKILDIHSGEIKKPSKNLFIEENLDFIKYFQNLGKKVIFVIDQPELDFDPNLCRERNNIFTLIKRDCKVSREVYDQRNKQYKEAVAEIKRKAPDILVYDKTNLFCDDKFCSPKKGTELYYYDDDHLNILGSEYVFRDFKIWFDKINTKN